MKNSLKERWPFALLSFFILITTALPFLKVYNLAQANTFFFVGMLALVCSMTLLVKNQLVILPFYMLSYSFTLYYYFPFSRSFGFSWFGVFVQKMLVTYPKMISGEINYLPDFFALAIILFLLILLNVLLIRYERWLLGTLLLIGYLLMLSVFNRLNLGLHVILITSFAILFYGLKHTPNWLAKQVKLKLFLLSSTALFLIAVGSYFFPVLFPRSQIFLITQTASIRDYVNQQGIYQKIEGYGSDSLATAGFSENNAQLGGPLSDDRSVLFTAKQTSEHYWRVETKNYYTGKGWKNTSEIVTTAVEQPLILATNPEYQGTLAAETSITLTFNAPKDYLPYPYGTISLQLNELGKVEQIKDKQRINLMSKPKSIQFTWQKPTFTQESLMQVPYQISLDEQNSQIPVTTPSRIKELAISITENQVTLYDKVKAVEHYLKQEGGYRYSKTDTPFTPQNEDYVDHFLFESKVGYCDNFSSAMIILLRSIGISSRWTKGFSPGELTRSENAGYQEYAIKNSDAHSWPEVYFEGYGWIPFEPTPSFTNEVSQTTTTTTSNSEKTIESSAETTVSSETKNQTEATSSNSEPVTKKSTQDSVSSPWLQVLRNIAIGLLIILLVVGSFFLKKYFFLLRFSLTLKLYPKQFAKAYSLLLRKAEHILPRQLDEPLTSYTQRFEHAYVQFHGSFIQLTELYEQDLYGDVKAKKVNYAGLLKHTARLLTRLK
ncbi:hypothetical protein A5819_000850 [Enterococcus sp. 7E2_DIV0204]|uniref:transglutaminase-like domain-containing protein n=1 Tax=unclassified Enterococcus TaxID=2608891 RepID=UPI000A330BE7|nr:MULTISPECIES: transglutaminase-like domain-containing protein [unclassified Enterococcus]OTN88369.1 hypothetical protein A5819_000850 [Enterococcus sp. 7E2_DIV0204]OTP50840.1 hypothetical protein A5884_000026 [Enterococcus sp. 7D2_DIV0200]